MECSENLFLKVFDDISTILLYCINYFVFLMDQGIELFSLETIFINTVQKYYLPMKYKNLIFLFQGKLKAVFFFD